MVPRYKVTVTLMTHILQNIASVEVEDYVREKIGLTNDEVFP